MQLGLQIPVFTWPQSQSNMGETFGLIARRAEQAGLYSLWVMDHLFQVEKFFGPPSDEMLEGWTALAFAAGHTNRIKLGTLVTGISYRHPGILIKTATTLDVLSHGRSYFGISTGWYEDECVGLGVPFPPLSERFERLEETLQIAHQMWAGNEKPFEGQHYHLTRPLNSPQAIQKPHPPILIGGGGERKTLRLVAQYGDACNLPARIGKEALQHKLTVLRKHCERLERPYDQIEKTTLLNSLYITRDGREGSITPKVVIQGFADLAALGFDHVIFSMRNVTDQEPFDLLAQEIVPRVAKITTAGRLAVPPISV
jgi:F420-dependent oxidoreductase-like protein